MKIRALFGLVSLRYDIPLIQFISLTRGVQVKVGEENKNIPMEDKEDDATITWEKINNSYDKFMKFLSEVSDYFYWLKQTMAKIHVTEFNWYTRLGIGEAPETAIATGMAWAVKSTVAGWLFQFVKLRKAPQLSVVPMYNRTLFSTELSCITKIRTGNAIIAGLKLLVRMIKAKGGIRRWQNILSKG